jgi:predicted nucleic acid-binding protein
VKVLDAGVVVGLLVGDIDPAVVGDDELAAPHLIDSEVTHVLRRLGQQGVLGADGAAAAMEGFMQLGLTRFPADRLRGRMWSLRHNLSGYDATYVALTEAVGASSLLTTDARLAAAPGIRCLVEVV